MRVEVVLAVPEALGSGIVRVPHRFGYAPELPGPNIRYGLIDREVGPVRLRCGREIGDSLGERDAALRHPDELHRVRRSHRDHERLRIGHADVFGGTDDDPPSNEPRIFARLDHPGEIVNGGVDIRSAHALDERADHVVMLVAVAVVTQQGSVDRRRDDLGRDDRLGAWFGCGGCGCCRSLERGQRPPRIPRRQPDERRTRLRVDRHQTVQSPLVADRTVDELAEVVV